MNRGQAEPNLDVYDRYRELLSPRQILLNLAAFLLFAFAAIWPNDGRSDTYKGIPGSGFDTDLWVGSAVYDPESGFFAYCSAMGVYGDQSLIQFRVRAGKRLELIVPVPPGTFENGAFLFVDELYLPAPVQIFGDQAYIDLSGVPSSMEIFQNGWYFTYEIGDFSRTYILRGTRAGLNAADECTRKFYLYRADNIGSGTTETPVTPEEPSQNKRTGGSGSGFIVGSGREVVTNAHVVNDCSRIEVDGVEASIVGSSEEFDLALLRTFAPLQKKIARFSPKPAGLNEDIAVAGYPLAQILRGLNITRGSVSSSAGPRGYDAVFQITAPIQPGNSGGPVINSNGEIVGVVVSKLAPLADGQIIPENVNFAIRGEIAKAFLAMHGMNTEAAQSTRALTPSEAAQELRAISVFVECFP